MPIVHITSADDERLLAYRGLTDRQLRSRLEPAAGVLVVESEKAVRVALAAGLEPISLLLEERQVEAQASLVERVLARPTGGLVTMRAGHVETVRTGMEPEVYVLPHEEASRLVGYNVTRGVLCAMRRPRERTAAEVLDSLPNARRIAVLEGVTDATNVGAAMRSAAALGVDAMLLSPTCCDPLVRRAVRVSMGTVFQVPWGRFGAWPAAGPSTVKGAIVSGSMRTDTQPGPDAGRIEPAGPVAVGPLAEAASSPADSNEAAASTPDGIELLHARGFAVAALALRDDSHALGEPGLRVIERLAMAFGTEGEGLDQATIDACDLTVKIPMAHGVDSLNVAAATAVTFWDLCR